MSNARAEQLLREAGIPFEPEPKWIKEGQKPDFYCCGKKPFWCEVKTLERPENTEKFHKAFHNLVARTNNLDGTGRAIAYIHDDYSDRDAKNVVHLLKRGLKRFDDGNAPDTIVALVPLSPHRKEFIRFSIATGTHGLAEFHSCVSPTSIYGSPDGIFADPFDQQVVQHFSDGTERTRLGGTFVQPNQTFLVAIVVRKNTEKFALLTAASALGVKRLKNPERIREVMSDANNQFKNGNRYKSASSLLAIFHEGLDVPDETIILSALYGNLKFSFPEGRPEKGEYIFDKDGGWTPEKNTTTSAVLYVRNSGEPLLVHNSWAQRPFPKGVFSCKEISLSSNGAFEESDFINIPASRPTLSRIVDLLSMLLRLLCRQFRR